MKLRSETAEIQEFLGKYCKTGEEVSIPGITDGRVHHYRRLVYNVVKNTMDQAFPITVSSMEEEEWNNLVHEFFANHQATSTQIWKLPYEFYQYHFSRDTGSKLEKPYLGDLLYFEWAEIKIHTMPDKDAGDFINEGNPITGRFVLNPEHELIQLSYPVHIHPVTKVEENKGSYYVLLFRHPDTGNVKFLDLSILHAFMLTKVQETGDSIEKFKGEIARIANVESEKFLDEFLSDFVLKLMDRKMILGYHPNFK